MKKLLFLLVFIPLVSFGQEDIERYKVYETTNIYTSLLLDTATGKIWHLQIATGDGDQLKYVLSDEQHAFTEEQITEEYNEDYKYWEENQEPNRRKNSSQLKIELHRKLYSVWKIKNRTEN